MIKQGFCIFQCFLQCQEALAGLLENHRVKAHTNPSQTLFHFLFCLSWLARLRVMTGAAVWCIKSPQCTVHTTLRSSWSFLFFPVLQNPLTVQDLQHEHCFFFFLKGEKVENALNHSWIVFKRLVACAGHISRITCFTLGLLWPTIMANVFPASKLSRCRAFECLGMHFKPLNGSRCFGLRSFYKGF